MAAHLLRRQRAGMTDGRNYIGLVGTDSSRRVSAALNGIYRFSKVNGFVVADFGPLGSLAQQAEAVTSWPVRGVLAFKPGIQTTQPTVEVLSQQHTGRPRVDVDHRSVGHAAFMHLRALNPKSVNLLRTPDCPDELLEGWRSASEEQSADMGDFLITSASPSLEDISAAERDRLHEWLLRLPRPAGIVCTNDAVSAACLACLRDAQVNVPDEVSIISCEDSLLAEQLEPTLSGISGNCENAGYEAARLLSRLIRGEAVDSSLVVVPGTTVTPRASTDRMAALPDDIRIAQEFIRDKSCEGINVKDVMRTQNVSRVTFERRFKEHTGKTPGAEIRRIRLEKAETLLKTTDMSVTQIATQCGFEGSSRFSLFFRKRSGLSPSEYRRRHK